MKEIWLPLQQKDKRWRLYITGNKPGIAEKLIDADFVSNNITSLGFVEDIEEVIGSKQYFISPTVIGSGVRIKVLNAMSAGAVCFVSPLDYDMLDALQDGKNVVKYSDFEDFYNKLKELENNREAYLSISLQARRLSTQFSWTDYIEKVRNEI